MLDVKDIQEKMDSKEKLIAKCRGLIMETIRNLEAEINEAQKAANEYGLPKDRYDSFRSQLLRKRDMFAQQLVKAKEQLTLLERINASKKQTGVEFGALVVFENQKLFVSVGLGKIELDGETYFAISPAVPIYKAMEGKKKGEEFEFNGRRNKILEVY
jgi:transcription elongation GreA/GreB family factor